MNRTSYKKLKFFFDVEATSLYGTGFGYGYVVTGEDDKGNLHIIEEAELYSTENIHKCDDWVKSNVLPYIKITDKNSVKTDKELRSAFFKAVTNWVDEGAEIWADVLYPVDARFLNAVVKDDVYARQWAIPYPVKDVATIVSTSISRIDYAGIRSNAHIHNPLSDAKASAITLHKYLRDKGIQL